MVTDQDQDWYLDQKFNGSGTGTNHRDQKGPGRGPEMTGTGTGLGPSPGTGPETFSAYSVSHYRCPGQLSHGCMGRTIVYEETSSKSHISILSILYPV